MTGNDLVLLIAWTGYAAAIWMYFGLGRVFWVPMALDLLYDIAGAKLGLWGDNIETLILMSAYSILLLLWVLYLAGAMHAKTAVWFTFGMVMVASFLGVAIMSVYSDLGVDRFARFVGLPGLRAKWSLLTVLSFYTWSTLTFLVILGVIVQSTLLRKLRGLPANIITNPRKRVLLPIALFTGIIGLSQLYHGSVPDKLYLMRFTIAGSALGWGWFLMELPFYLMYRRMLKQRD